MIGITGALLALLLVAGLILFRLHGRTPTDRRILSRWLRSGMAHDEPWSSGALCVLVAVVVTFAFYVALNPAPATVVALVPLAALTCWGLARRFSRKSLRTVTVLLLVLGGTGVLGLGHTQIRAEARASASRAVDRFTAQLDVLDATLPELKKVRDDSRSAIAAVRAKIPPGSQDPVDQTVTEQLSRLEHLLALPDPTADAIQTAEDVKRRLNEVKARVQPREEARQAVLDEAIAQAEQLKGAPTLTLGAPVAAARASVKHLQGLIDGDKTKPKEISDATAQAQLATAQAVLKQRSDDAAKKAATAAETDYLAAVQQKAVRPSVTEGFSAGGRAVADEIRGMPGPPIPFDLGTTGWIVVAALGLVLYRRLERRVGRGELLLNQVTSSGGDDDTATRERFRTYLSRNIPEPSAIPGATSPLAPITDLLNSAAATPATWIAKALDAVAKALKEPRGAAVSVAVLEDAKAANTGTAKTDTAGAAGVERAGAEPEPVQALVVVRVSPPGASQQSQRTFGAPTLDEALRIGAYWAAAVLIERSKRAPHWAVWKPEACHALATYYAEADNAKAPPLNKMQEAVAIAPHSGLLLMELANRYALEDNLEDNMVEAFAASLRAASLYPRWPVAKYRMAVTAVMLAADGVSQWNSADDATRAAVCAALRRGKLEEGPTLATSLTTVAPAEQRLALCRFAQVHLAEARKQVGYGRLWRGVLRTNERSYWVSLLQTRQHIAFRTQFDLLARSAEVMASIRAQPGEPISPPTDPAVDEEGLSWQLAYNLACMHTQRALYPFVDQGVEVTTALELLELAVTRPGGEQLTTDWLEADPDLRPLREEPRFQALAQRLPKKETKR